MTKTMTDKEKQLIQYITKASNFNFNKIDWDKTFDEQRFENGDFWSCIVKLKEFNQVLGTNNAATRGIIGSLVKKDMCYLTLDDGLTWLTINEENFNNIKEALKEGE